MRFSFPKPTAESYRVRYRAVFSRLPETVALPILRFLSSHRFRTLSEIRLHKGCKIGITLDGKNFVTNEICTADDLADSVVSLCDGSIYAHEKTILDGYIGCENGIRAGVCGRAVIEGGRIVALGEINGINVRIPNRIRGLSDELFALAEKERFSAGILVYSPPGVGKTTVLRELYYRLCDLDEPIRFAVIDERGELSACLDEPVPQNAPDVFLGYPKATAIELATRLMSPELLLCDEIGSDAEADAILATQNAEVPLIASVHAADRDDLTKKEGIARLLRAGVFSYVVGLRRFAGSRRMIFDVEKAEPESFQVAENL